MASHDLDRLWSDPRSWSRLGVYRCAQDPRLIVPKRRRLGWTLNFAHRRSWLALLGSILIAAGPTVALVLLGRPTIPAVIITIACSIVALVAVSAWESGRRRR